MLYHLRLEQYNIVGIAVGSTNFVRQLTILTTDKATGLFTVFGPYGEAVKSVATLGSIQSFYGRKGRGINKLGVQGIGYYSQINV